MIRVVELYCGIGGVTAALVGHDATVVGAFDVSTLALSVYRHNFDDVASARAIESLSAARLASLEADLWWASPPCQPFTHRGRRRDLDDPRAASYPHLAGLVDAVRPPFFALENVPGFVGSRADRLISETLQRAGYELRHELLCPTRLGIPNRRERLFLLASRRQPPREPVIAKGRRPLADFLDPAADHDRLLQVPEAFVERYRRALHLVDADDPAAVAACFTAAYGRSRIRSGSYLRHSAGVRRFSPDEVLRLLGFPESFTWPPDCRRDQAWRLAGNALSVPAVRTALACLDLPWQAA